MKLPMLLCAVLLCASAALACDEERMTTVEEVRSVLVEGMAADDVERFFIEQGLAYSILRGQDLLLEQGLRTEQERAGVHARYQAIIRDVAVRLGRYREDIQIKVDVDEHGRALRVLVRPVHTGP